MSRHVTLPGLSLALVIACPSYAAELSSTAVIQTDSGVATTNEIALSPSERARARVWELSETEWQRYKALLQGIRGSVSPATLSPIEVLGIHARDDEERQRYAAQWARLMHEDAERILAFQRAYDAAGKRLYPTEPLIDADQVPAHTDKKSSLQQGDRVLFFTQPDCPACDVLLSKVLAHIDRVAGIDIYIAGVNPVNDQAIRDWAAEQGIAAEWVRQRRVTLNHEAGVLEKLTRGKGEIPYLLRRRDEDMSVLRASEL